MKQLPQLSQVFLKDMTYQKKIIDAMQFEQRTVLEIGSGTGQLSELIAHKAKKIYCVEIDRRFQHFLEEKFKNFSNVDIIKKDILKVDLSQFSQKITIFGNVPYQISKKIICYLIENRQKIKTAYLTLQKEFVDKLIAKSNTESYGFLTCYVQYYARCERIFNIPAQAFYPIPKVNSSFIQLSFHEKPLYPKINDSELFKFIRQAFSQRRKKIVNLFPELKENPKILELFNIPLTARAENLTLINYISLSSYLQKNLF